MKHTPNFVAIDFETATSKRTSACALALVAVKDGQIVDSFYSLIRPPGNEYWGRCSQVHGITAPDTQRAPTFLQLYPQIEQHCQGKVLVAHNMPFDKSVFHQTMDLYGIDADSLQVADWVCTLKIYRQKGFKPAGLADCCRRLCIPLNHHQALSDATACAALYLAHLNPTP